MTTALTLRSVKGSALTHNEVDGNFTALRTTADGALPNSGTATNPALTVDSNLSGAFQILDAQGTRLMFDFDSIQGNKSGDTIFPALDDVWNLGKATNNRWQNAYISRTIELGDTPFIFTESSPDVLQLGDANVTLQLDNNFSMSLFASAIYTTTMANPNPAIQGLNYLLLSGSTLDLSIENVLGGNHAIELADNGDGTAVLFPVFSGTINLGVAGNVFSSAYFGTSVAITPVNVVNLPAAPIAGEKAIVNNALAPAFGVAVAGSGGVTVPVFYDGAQWVVG